MRSLIILEVEHGDDTDFFEDAVHNAICGIDLHTHGAVVNDYTVRVDLPACFVLDSGHTN